MAFCPDELKAALGDGAESWVGYAESDAALDRRNSASDGLQAPSWVGNPGSDSSARVQLCLSVYRSHSWVAELKISDLIVVISQWASGRPLIQRVYLFGSRVRGDVRHESDVDIAIELDPDQCQDQPEGATAVWHSEVDGWREELQASIPFRADLRLYLGDLSPVIKAGLQRSNVLAYEKPGSRQPPWLDSLVKRSPRCNVLIGH